MFASRPELSMRVGEVREGGRRVNLVGEGGNRPSSLELELQREVAWQIPRG